MGMSARVLGREFGRTAREMNVLLKQHGYLDGEPGAYGLTEKGQAFGDEQHHDNGYGGYAYRQWETRTWNDDTAAALRADMDANPDGFPPPSTAAADSLDEPDISSDPSSQLDVDAGVNGGAVDWKDVDWKKVAIIGGAVVAVAGGILVAPHVKPWWNDKVKPAAKRMRSRLTRREAVEAQALESPEGVENAGDSEES